ncbi:hypothetical protein B0H14DRAFT_276617 [Mycena olivaceomarginata]|nr:hypothetical protein B0H14DRAFT_276617 [Mycena olivaceomarginata]
MRRLARLPLLPHSIRIRLTRIRPTPPARARVSGSRRCSSLPPPLLPGRKGASQRRRRVSPPTSPPPLSGKRRRRRRGRRVRCPTATRTRTCRSRRWSRVCRLPPLLLLRLLCPRPLPRRNGASRPRPSRSPTPPFASMSTCSASAPIAGPGRYTGWHPRPRASQLRLALAVEPLSLLAPHSPAPCASSPYSAHAQERAQQQQQCQQQPDRALRSRWSSSTLSSVHSAHARRSRSPGAASSPKTFAFARAAGVRRYMHFPKSPSASKPKPKPMGSATVLSGNGKGKGKGGKRLTVEDVCVISPAPVPAPPASPAPFPATPTCGATASTPCQRWSYSSRASSSRAAPSGSESSDSGHSDSDDCGMRRKPIPVGLFLR